MILFRFFLPLAVVLGLLAYLLLPWTGQLFQSWSEADLKSRSKLVFSSIEDGLSEALNVERASQLTKRFTEMAKDERLIGIGYCDDVGAPKYHNKDFPTGIRCPNLQTYAKPDFSKQFIKGGPVFVATFPVTSASSDSSKPGYLLIVHDMSYATRRGENTQRYAIWFILCVSLVTVTITVVTARLTLSRWMNSLRDYVRTGKRTNGLPREAIGITREIQQRLRKLERELQQPSLMGTRWSPESLYNFVHNNLPSEQIINVSYRQPYAHNQTASGLTWSTPASGLVTAIEPIMKACKGTWIAVGSSDADKLSADADGALMVPPDEPSYRLKRLWLTEEEESGFYAGLANEGIWPLCNLAYVKPRFRASDWAAYQAVNQKFADAIVAEAKSSSPIIFIQDYHFGLLPKLVRERLPNALIIVFWHIPWPNTETLGILPWREEFLCGLLASDIIGFHTQYFCNNFLDCIDTHVEALIDREHDTVRHGGDLCMIRPYPISIAWPDFSSLALPDIQECRKEIISRLNLPKDAHIILGVERLDYIKGIPERLRAFGDFLEKNPQWQGKVSFVQIASPSRSIIPAYADIGREVEQTGAEINRKFSAKGWTPVHILKQNFSQQEVYRFYRAADVCVVSSLHDGMNLVAKEFVASREDDNGVLILSQFSGSSRELIDAIIVNPYDELGLSQSFQQALTMKVEEVTARMHSMREHVKSHNVFAWAAQILGDAAKLHQRRQINSVLQKPPVLSHEEESASPESGKENILPWPTQSKHR